MAKRVSGNPANRAADSGHCYYCGRKTRGTAAANTDYARTPHSVKRSPFPPVCELTKLTRAICAQSKADLRAGLLNG